MQVQLLGIFDSSNPFLGRLAAIRLQSIILIFCRIAREKKEGKFWPLCLKQCSSLLPECYDSKFINAFSGYIAKATSYDSKCMNIISGYKTKATRTFKPFCQQQH
jgi:hypothetical protein